MPAQLLASSILETLAVHWGFGGSEQGSQADPKKALARKALKGGIPLGGEGTDRAKAVTDLADS
jgi:hypothetical protein